MWQVMDLNRASRPRTLLSIGDGEHSTFSMEVTYSYEPTPPVKLLLRILSILPVPGMSPHLIITAAVFCGHCARRLRCIMNNYTDPSKKDPGIAPVVRASLSILGVSGIDSHPHPYGSLTTKKNTDPSKVDNTSDDNFEKLDGEIPISLNHGDCLTDLPDEILSYILTHLKLRDVVRTSTLSKRWKNIWLSLPKLDLEWSVMSRYKGLLNYVNWVNKVLRDYHNQDISSFRISFNFKKEYAGHVDHWISFASKKCIQSLTLQFITYDHFCSLLQFSIQNPSRPKNMYPITSSNLSCFPCLKDLRLDACNLKLHSDFRLRIRWCNLPEKLCIGENLQRLSSLAIHDGSDLREIELNAKSLNFFDFVGRAIVKFSFLSATKLKSSNVALIDKNYKGAECIIRDMDTSNPSLETLFLEAPYSLMHVIPTHPSTSFRHVVWLSLFFEREDPEVDMVKSFPRLLNSFQQLQKLYLMVPYPTKPRRYELPDVCLNTSIKEVELGNFKMDWIPCASYFLKSTVALDRMLISRHITKYTCEGEWKRSVNHSFSQQECDYIRFALQGSAVSQIADLVIQGVWWR